MFPIIFKYKLLTIGGYGVMLALGFYLAFLLLEREFKLRDINPELAYKILLLAIPCGIVGSRIFHILENLEQFVTDPINMIFSNAGASAYGGYLMAFFLAIIMIKKIMSASSESLTRHRHPSRSVTASAVSAVMRPVTDASV